MRFCFGACHPFATVMHLCAWKMMSYTPKFIPGNFNLRKDRDIGPHLLREHFVIPFLIYTSVSFNRLPYIWGKEPSSIYVCIPCVQHDIDVQLILVNWMNVCAWGSEKLLKTAGLPRLLLMSGRLYLNSYLHNSWTDYLETPSFLKQLLSGPPIWEKD